MNWPYSSSPSNHGAIPYGAGTVRGPSERTHHSRMSNSDHISQSMHGFEQRQVQTPSYHMSGSAPSVHLRQAHTLGENAQFGQYSRQPHPSYHLPEPPYAQPGLAHPVSPLGQHGGFPSQAHNRHYLATPPAQPPFPVRATMPQYVTKPPPKPPANSAAVAQGRAINQQLLAILLREPVIDTQQLDILFDHYVESMDNVNLATLLFHTGKNSVQLSVSQLERVVDRFQVLRDELRAREASNTLYGLKEFSSDVPQVRRLVHLITAKMAASNSVYIAQAVGNAMFGLQGMTADHAEVRSLLVVLAAKLHRCVELLDAMHVGNALYGLRGMTSDCAEVRHIIAAMTPLVLSAREALNSKAIVNALYGLQSMSSSEMEVRRLVHALATKIATAVPDLIMADINMALQSIKGLNRNTPEVRMLLSALTDKIAHSQAANISVVPQSAVEHHEQMLASSGTSAWDYDGIPPNPERGPPVPVPDQGLHSVGRDEATISNHFSAHCEQSHHADEIDPHDALGFHFGKLNL